jgi:hypothetical protein
MKVRRIRHINLAWNSVQEFIQDRPPMSHGSSGQSSTNHDLDMAIDAYRKMPVLPQYADPLVFWRDNSASPLLQPLLPLVASVSAVPAIEAICEQIFKA